MKLQVERENLGEYLHTALRKVCDSTETSLAWNLINIYLNGNNSEGVNVWSEYLDNVWSGLNFVGEKTTYDEVLRVAAERLDYGSYYSNTLRLAFSFFNDGDFIDMGSYLYE